MWNVGYIYIFKFIYLDPSLLELNMSNPLRVQWFQWAAILDAVESTVSSASCFGVAKAWAESQPAKLATEREVLIEEITQMEEAQRKLQKPNSRV
jgi:hypothetical protein